MLPHFVEILAVVVPLPHMLPVLESSVLFYREVIPTWTR
jgi:hypothetical protein